MNHHRCGDEGDAAEYAGGSLSFGGVLMLVKLAGVLLGTLVLRWALFCLVIRCGADRDGFGLC